MKRLLLYRPLAACGKTASGSTVNTTVSTVTGKTTPTIAQCPYGGTQATTTTVTQIQLCTNGTFTNQGSPVTTTVNSGSPNCTAPAMCGTQASGSTYSVVTGTTTGTTAATIAQCRYYGSVPTITTTSQLMLCTNGVQTALGTPTVTTAYNGSPVCDTHLSPLTLSFPTVTTNALQITSKLSTGNSSVSNVVIETVVQNSYGTVISDTKQSVASAAANSSTPIAFNVIVPDNLTNLPVAYEVSQGFPLPSGGMEVANFANFVIPAVATSGQVCISMASSVEQYYNIQPALDAQTELGMKLDMFRYSESIGDQWRPTYMNAIFNQGWIAFGSWDLYDTNILQEIVSGNFDTAITQLAVGSIGHPMLVRYLAEFNLHGSVYYGNPALYIAAYRHIHDLWRAAGNNSPFLWSPNVTVDNGSNSFAAYYPGDAYVDIVGLDGYRTQYYAGTPIQLFSNDIATLKSITKKPIAISETGAISTMPNRAAWIASLFDYVISDPHIIMLDYWERENNTLAGDPASLQAFTAGVAKWRLARKTGAGNLYSGQCTDMISSQ